MNWRRLLKMGTTFFLGSTLSRLIGLVAFPVYTYFLSPASVGYYDLSISYGAILGGFLFMDVWIGVMRRLLAPSEGTSPSAVVKAGLTVLISAIVVLACFALVLEIVLDVQYVWWVFLCVTSGGLRDLWTFVARGQGKTTVFAVSGLVASAVTAVTTVALLMFTTVGVVALYAGVLAGQLAQLVYTEALVKVIPLRGSRLQWPVLKSLLIFVFPLGINSVSYWLFTGIGRIAISRELSMVENGLYATANKFGAILGVLSGVVTLVWQQVSFTKDRDQQLFFERGLTLSIGVYIGGCALLAPIGSVLYRYLVAPEFHAGTPLVAGFIVVAALAGYSAFVGNVFYSIEKTQMLLYSSIIVLMVVCATTFPFVRTFGVDGANLSLAIGYISGILVEYIVLRKYAAVHVSTTVSAIALVGLMLVWFVAAHSVYWLSAVLAAFGLLTSWLLVRSSLKR